MPWLIAVPILIVALLAVALRIQPRGFPPYPGAAKSPDWERVPLRVDLPAPARRYFEKLFPDGVPLITSAVISGKATLRLGLPLPARFRFTHDAGKDYRHYIEVVIFGYPLFKVNERFWDGKGRMELPFATYEDTRELNSAANLGLWGESIWLPSIWLTDSRVRWEAIDDQSCRLIVPFGAESDSFTVRFDPQTGMIDTLTAMRHRDAAPGAKLIGWQNKVLEWRIFHGIAAPKVASVQWLDQSKPWALWTIEEVAYNVDVTEYVRAKGI